MQTLPAILDNLPQLVHHQIPSDLPMASHLLKQRKSISHPTQSSSPLSGSSTATSASNTEYPPSSDEDDGDDHGHQEPLSPFTSTSAPDYLSAPQIQLQAPSREGSPTLRKKDLADEPGWREFGKGLGGGGQSYTSRSSPGK